MKISFLVEPFEGHESVLSVTPAIAGVSLAELVHKYETKYSYEPAGGYGVLSLRISITDLSMRISWADARRSHLKPIVKSMCSDATAVRSDAGRCCAR